MMQGDNNVTSLALSILDKSTKSFLLVFYGNQNGKCSLLPGNAACCIYTDPTYEAILELFDKMQSIILERQDQPPQTSYSYTSVVRGIHFVDYEFEQVPPNIGPLFPHVTQCSFYKCHQFTSFCSTLEQFPSLTTLAARDCPALTSLDSLSCISPTMSLQAIRINNCGLVVSSNQDWDDAMQSLGRTPSSGLVLNITSCQSLRRLPSTVRHLRNVLSCLRLETNYNLNYLPDSLGELSSMVEFQLINCPSIHALPPSMQRLKADCKVSITGNTRLIQRISDDSHLTHSSSREVSVDYGYGVGTSSRWALSYFSQKISKMKPYYHQNQMRQFRATVELSVLLHRARFRAIHRIYRPGGAGFQRCRDSFQMTVQEWSSSGTGGSSNSGGGKLGATASIYMTTISSGTHHVNDTAKGGNNLLGG